MLAEVGASGFFDSWPGVLTVFVGGIAFVLFLLSLVARLEKRRVWPYGQPERKPQFDSYGYGVRRAAEAVQAGFTFFGWAPDVKGEKYQVSYGLLASPERDSFVVIGVGTIFNMPMQGTWIHTPVGEGRSFYTADHQNCIEIDASRRWISQLVSAKSFPELWQKHTAWAQSKGVAPRRLEQGREIDDFRKIREEHYQSLSQRGFIKYIDDSRNAWRYTWSGALRFAVLNFFIGLVRTITFGRFPRSA